MTQHISHDPAHNWGLPLLRIHFGIILLAHGLVLKVMTFTIPGTVGYFASLGIPAIASYLIIFGEVCGGLALIAGFQTRLVSALSLPILIGATLFHLPSGWLFSAEGGGWEFPASLVVIALTLVMTGGGGKSLAALPAVNDRLPSFLKN